MRLLLITTALFLTLFANAADTDSESKAWAYDPQTPNAICPSPATCEPWLQFRSVYTWPYQTFAIRQNDAEAVVIISEPPPVFSRAQLTQVLKALFQDNLVEVSRYHWPTGLDGWLEDVVMRVRLTKADKTTVLSGATLLSWEAPSEVVDRLRILHQLFYHTSDGFWLDQIGNDTAVPIQEIKVPLSDIAGWLADTARVWTSATQTDIHKTSRQLYTESPTGVFHSGGLVALIAPRGVTKMPDLAADFRRFAVATDFIVGATGSKNGSLLLFGRSRQIPLSTLPPLRFETLTSFAMSPTEHLAQSYERQRIFAGRIQTGKYAGWDWAPILLSPQLDDSEFGTLLNQADQVLKSWSQHGQVEYYGFMYPKPATYPFGDIAASDYFHEKFQTTSLLFNWNTEGLATVTTVNGREILTSDRTGALPVLYRAGNLVADADTTIFAKRSMDQDADARAKEAREYFAANGNPILVRVLQDVLLYQAVQSFLVTDKTQPTKSSRSEQVNAVLEKRATAWLADIAQGKNEADRETQLRLTKFMETTGFTTARLARIIASPQSVERDLQRASQRFRTSLADTEWMETFLKQAAANADALFYETCASVGGQIKKDALGREGCEWRHNGSDNETADEVFSAYLTYTKRVEGTAKDYAASEKSMANKLADLISLAQTYSQASQLGEALSLSSGTADLDDVLREVLERTASIQTPGFIRTPSVVLSKNSVDVEAVGGHNIDLIPQKRVVAPTIPENLVKGPIKKTSPSTLELAPPRPEVATLAVQRQENLLDVMRASAKRAEGDAATPLAIQERAKVCQCEALVVQGEDGLVYYVRNAPPPGHQTILGKSGVIDALTSPPPVRVVRFENFSESTVENIARSTALITDGPHEGVFDRALGGLAGLLKGSENGGRTTTVTIERAGEPEVLRISEEPGSVASLKDPIAWHASTVEETTETRWTEIFGEDAKLPPSSDALIVRFGTKPGIDSGWLGIRVEVESAGRPGILGRLKAVVSRWLSSQPLKPVPWADGVADLRAAIKRQLAPTDLEFYYRKNKARIRVADSRRANDCIGGRCRS
jgi:hypothetical protein